MKINLILGALIVIFGALDASASSPAQEPAVSNNPPVGPEIINAPRSTQVQQGASASLSVAAKSSHGGMTYQWFKNGTELVQATGSTLQLTNCKKTDTGFYHVVVSDSAGNTATEPVCLYVIDAVALRYRMDQDPRAGEGVIMDETGNTSGTLVGKDLPELAPGASPATRKSWDFIKTKTYLSIPATSPALRNFGNIENSPGMSVAFWYNFDINTSRWTIWQTLASLGNIFRIDFAFDIGQTGLEFKVGDDVAIPLLSAAVETRSGLLKGGNWHHYVLTMDYRNPIDEKGQRARNVLTYVDGKLSGGYPNPGPQKYTFQESFLPKTTDCLILGAKSKQPQQKWADFTIYNYPLSQKEIQELYTTGQLRAVAPQIFVKSSDAYVLTQKPIATLGGNVYGYGQPLPISCQWTLKSGPVGGKVMFSDPSSVRTTAAFSPVPGTYTLEFTANNTVWSSNAFVVVNLFESLPMTAFASIGGKPEARVLTGADVTRNGAYRVLDESNVPGTICQWSKVSGPADPVITQPSEPNSKVRFSVPGTYVLNFSATSGTSHDTARVIVHVFDEMLEAVIGTASPQILLWPENSVTLSSSVRQTHQESPVTYSWTKIRGEGSVTFSNSEGATTQATFTTPGVYQLNVSAKSKGGEGECQVWVNIWPDKPGTDKRIKPPVARQLTPQPPPFVHPRYLFSEADRAELTDRALHDPVDSDAIAKIRAELNKTILNPESTLGRAYLKMLRGDRDFCIQSERLNSGLYTKLAEACYVAWLDKDEAWMQKLATVIGNSARDELKWNHETDGKYASTDFALCYDLAFNAMSEDQRCDCRELLTRMTKGVTIGGFHWQYLQPWYSIPLAYYKEPGYDEKTVQLNFDSIKYAFCGWTTSPGGWKLEDTAYGGFSGQSICFHAIPFSRQIEPLHVTGGMARETQMEFYLLYADTTAASMKPGLGGHSEGGWAHSGQEYLLHKYCYPTDPLDDLVRRVNHNMGKGGSLLTEAIFGLAPLSDPPAFASIAAARNMPLTKFDPQRGLGTTRSDWTENAAQLDFDCRFDTFASGHLHANRNHFTLFALGREWVTGPGYGEFANEGHSTIMIDGIGSTRNPGRFLDVVDQKEFTMFSGDAKLAYDYESVLAPSSEPPKGNFQVALPLTWKDVMFPGSSDGTIPALSPEPFRFVGNEDSTDWVGQPIHVRARDGVALLHNPVQRAFRSVLLVRGSQPYVLVVDDIQKDDQPHDYQWAIQMRKDLQARPSPTAADAILFHEADAEVKDAPQCLIRALQAEGAPSPITVGESTYNSNSKNRVVITRKTVSPNFKVLLFPHHQGDVLPTTVLNKNLLTVTLANGQTDTFTFTTGADGRTKIQFQRQIDLREKRKDPNP